MQIPAPVTVDKVMAEQRAASFTRRSIKNDAKRSGLRLALSMVDLTTLEGKDTPEKVRSLCRKAVDPSDGSMSAADLPTVAAICVYPQMVAAAKKELAKMQRGGSVKVAAVATGFPSGQYPLKVRLDDTRRAVDAGADEIDMVISRGAFLAGEFDKVYDEVCATVEACGFRKGVTRKDEGFAHLKVILETGELETLDNARRASDIAIAAMHDCGLTKFPGAGFIKTSTGKVEPAATMPVTLVMLEAIRDHWLSTANKNGVGGELVGMKPAGGIRAAKSSLHYLVMVKETLGEIENGAYLSPKLFRFGASALVNDLVRQLLWLDKGRYAARYDFAEA
ncbi:MAG: deoxyribose-phosphate aldolase [Phycisphaerales bacterium]|nr:deoxyribose-phosphate aldolase [Phycisphaerales bacterium]